MDWNVVIKSVGQPPAQVPYPRLRVRLLGGFKATIGQQQVVLANRKEQTLLAYLALDAAQEHSREKLATLLWGNFEDSAARHSLRQALTALRKAGIDEGLVATTRHTVTVNVAEVETDVGRFKRLSAQKERSALEEAVALYSGDLLDGVEFDDDPIQDWVAEQRRGTRDLAGATFGRLAALYQGENQVRRAIDCYRRLMQLDPYNEQALRMSMELLVAAGRGLEALFNYQEFSNLLQRELGVEPEPATKELYLKIAEGRLVRTAAGPGEQPAAIGLVDAFRSLDGFVMWDQADRFVLCNDKFREIFAPAGELLKPGVVWEDIMERCISKRRFPEALADPAEYLKKRIKRRRLGTAEAPDVVLDDGRCFRLTHRRTENGALIVIFTDTTDRKQRERALERSHSRLQTLLNVSPLPIEEVDLDGRVTFCSAGLLELLEYDANEILGHVQNEFMPVPWVPAAAEATAAAEQASGAANRRPIEAEYRTKSGDRIRVTAHWDTLRDDGGKVSGYIAFIVPSTLKG